MSQVLKPPVALPQRFEIPTVFLAGSIESDRAERWQDRLQQELADLDVLILNPRRDEWDESWRQEADNAQFREQVEWELDGQERCDFVVFYFSPGTRSPITLLELGLATGRRRAIVFCPEGFWRKGNVDLVCLRYGIDKVDSWSDFVKAIREAVSRVNAGSKSV